ncbi:MAG: glycosyltransferase family 39 protein [Chloroflexota bacterium]
MNLLNLLNPTSAAYTLKAPAQSNVEVTATHNYRLATITVVLVLTAISRLIYVASLPMNWDEVWSIWQTFGSLGDIIKWTPRDWPPLYFLSLGVWKTFAGIDPVSLRHFSILGFMLGAAIFYRVSRRLWNEQVAVLAVLVYGALGFNIFLSLLIRGYAFLLALTPLMLWLTVRYFNKPTLWRAILLALCMIGLFFIHFTSAFVFVVVGLYTLIVYRQAVWRWWLPGLISGVPAVIEIVSKLGVFETRTNYTATLPLPPLPEALYNTFATYTGPSVLVWVVLFVAATVLLFARQRLQPKVIAMFIWAFFPVLIYIFHSKLGLFQDTRYMWWVVPGLAWWIGWGLSYLPRIGTQLVMVVLAGVLFWPGAIDNYQGDLYHLNVPFIENFKFLKKQLRPGDVIVIDPNCKCVPTEAWDYFMQVYFPTGLTFVDNPAGYRRVWYVSADWRTDPETKAAVMKGRVAGIFYGPATFLFRLYEAPPDPTGILFENGLRFHGIDVDGILYSPAGPVLHRGATLHIRLWWSIDKAIPMDYSIAAFVKTPMMTAQIDGPPHVVNDGTGQTSQWVLGRYYVDERELYLPDAITDGNYEIQLAVYDWGTQARVRAPGVDADTLLPIQAIKVHSW